jgi:hypothetical protein
MRHPAGAAAVTRQTPLREIAPKELLASTS